MNRIRTCVSPEGMFIYVIHKPSYTVTNVRGSTRIAHLGCTDTGELVDNRRNYPPGKVEVPSSDWIYEIANPLPFKGATFIDKEWADASAADYSRMRLPKPEPVSFSKVFSEQGQGRQQIELLPAPLQLALATCSTDPDDLIALAEISCNFTVDADQNVTGLLYREVPNKGLRPVIVNHPLFEAVANNPHLPDTYKVAMVIRPGAQGGSEIVGEYESGGTSHVYEYLRRNSYIGGGHYAANMAEDAIRYTIDDLSREDMRGLRHLYYQRTLLRLAELLGLGTPQEQRSLETEELEALRREVVNQAMTADLSMNATLWGWNFGFDYAPSRYRLHASHQQIHQQYALIPAQVDGYSTNPRTPEFTLPAYGCGDLIADVIQRYRLVYDRDFFADYVAAIVNNKRLDGREDLDESLVVWRDERVMLFVPKAQTSQWELQLMTLEQRDGNLAGNIVEADGPTRESLDTGIYLAQRALAGLGARMVTSIEYPKRIGRAGQPGQPLLYCFLPRLPESPGAFSEMQLRFINGHYPEDFAAVCRHQLP